MGVNGKQKGNTFERKMANVLSERFAAHTGIEKPFRRNPDSGSFFGGTNIDRKEIYDTDWAVYGDLICPRNFNFSVECKHYKKAPILNAILNEKVTEWDKWIGQAKQDAEACEKDMLIIIKYNNTEELVITEADTIDEEPIIIYKDMEIHTLKTVLENPDPFFFTEPE